MPADPDKNPNGSPQTREPANPEQSPSFETGLAQLAEIVNQLEGGGLGLSASIEAYERGVAMLGRLHAELADAEQRVKVLLGIDEEGRPVLHSGLPAQAAQPRTDGAARPADGPIPAADDGDSPPSSTSASRRTGGGRASSARSTDGSTGKTPRSRSLPGMDGT